MNNRSMVSISGVASELGLSPSWIRQLTEAGVFTAERTAGGHRRYDLAATRAVWMRYRLERSGVGIDGYAPPALASQFDVAADRAFELEGLAEDQVWDQIRPTLGLPDSSASHQILGYAFTEMVNNAIDHSGGKTVRVRAGRGDGVIQLVIEDDGRGAFAHLAEGLHLPDHFAAIQELSKGKRTTAPDRHTGEGIFFTSKAVDVFQLAANGIAWTVDNRRDDQAVGISMVTDGTAVKLELDPETDRDLGALFREFTKDHEFSRSRPVVKLFGLGVSFVSRSEAKRLLAGMESFSEVEIDFTGVDLVGQAFVDELLRVWPRHHPGTVLQPTGMNPAVEFMVRRGLRAEGAGGDTRAT